MVINLDVKISFSSESQKRPMSFSTTPVFFWRCLLADWTASGFDKHDTFYKLMQHMDIATPSEQLVTLWKDSVEEREKGCFFSKRSPDNIDTDIL